MTLSEKWIARDTLMSDDAWKKMATILDKCTEIQEAHGVDPGLWGVCEQCPAAEECTIFKEPCPEAQA